VQSFEGAGVRLEGIAVAVRDGALSFSYLDAAAFDRFALKVVPVIELQLSEGFDPAVIKRWLRVCGDSLRRINETEMAWWHSQVMSRMLASGMTEGEMLKAQADLGSRMAPPPRAGPAAARATAAAEG
jgi:hypothetical protein